MPHKTHGTRFEPSAWDPTERVTNIPKGQPAARTDSTLSNRIGYSFKVAFLAEPSMRGKRALISISISSLFISNSTSLNMRHHEQIIDLTSEDPQSSKRCECDSLHVKVF